MTNVWNTKIPDIPVKSKQVDRFWFSVQNNLRQKCVNHEMASLNAKYMAVSGNSLQDCMILDCSV